MQIPFQFSLRFLLVAVAVIAVVTTVVINRLYRGWTVEKVERLIAAEFNPACDRFPVECWLESHAFKLAFPASATSWTTAAGACILTGASSGSTLPAATN
jgi:hypothetical protein